MARGKGRSTAPTGQSGMLSPTRRWSQGSGSGIGIGFGKEKGGLGYYTAPSTRRGRRWLSRSSGVAWVTGLLLCFLYFRRRGAESSPGPTSPTTTVPAPPLHDPAEPLRKTVAGPAGLAGQVDAGMGAEEKHNLQEALRRPPATTPTPPSPRFVDLSPFPVPHPPPDPTSPEFSKTRYLSYFPHSGYHNQRLSLENAFTLAALLDRTLLLPPAWLGHAIPYISYDKLQRRVATATKEGLEHCVGWAEAEDGGAEQEKGPLPRECVGFFDFTTVGWDFLVDLDSLVDPILADDPVEGKPTVPQVKVVSRTNFSDAWLTDALGLSLPKDAHYIKDATPYEFKFYSDPSDNAPLEKWSKRLDIQDLLKPAVAKKRLLAIGTLFGTARIRTADDLAADARRKAREAMVFKNPMLDRASDEIVKRLGGASSYYSLHLRIGDGVFRKDAVKNVDEAVKKLVTERMKISDEVLERARRVLTAPNRPAAAGAAGIGGGVNAAEQGRPRPKLRLDRPEVKKNDGPIADQVHVQGKDGARLERRANARPQKDGTYNHKPLPALPVIRTRTDSPLDSTLTCRGRFHSEPDFLPFNAPLFLATDSAIPTTDPAFTFLFRLFPCTFVLGDFFSPSEVNSEAVPALVELSKVRNKEDKVELGSFLIPFVDAMVAAKGRAMVGTTGSTFSRFAVDVLHQNYHGWPIVERG